MIQVEEEKFESIKRELKQLRDHIKSLVSEDKSWTAMETSLILSFVDVKALNIQRLLGCKDESKQN